jgi:hypothetical protein
MPSLDNSDTEYETDETGWSCIKCGEDVAQGDLHECLMEDEEQDAII